MTITGIHHFAFAVPDLVDAATFYGDFGLDIAETDNGLGARSPGRSHDEIQIVEGPVKRLHHIGFRSDEEGVERVRASLAEAGTAVRDDPPSGGSSDGIWFQDPFDVWVNVCVADVPDPGTFGTAPYNTGDSTARVDVAAWTEYDRAPRPRQLGHYLIFTPDIVAAEAWYSRHLGFIVSDRSLGKATFMRVGDGFHHIFGFIGTSDHTGFHHASFEVAGADEIVLGTEVMEDKGHQETWGLGRHTIGSNLFSYIQDPWGSWCEYFSDMDRVTEAWVATDVEAPPHVWSPPVEPDFFPKKFFHNAEPGS